MTSHSSTGLRSTSKVTGRVLVVDDSVDSLRIVDFHLRRAGIEVVVAHDGAQALEGLVGGATMRSSARKPHFDLVLLDMQMPGISGLETIRALRQRGFRTPVIAITGMTEASYREQCLGAGCNDYLPKPLNAEKLVAACTPFLHLMAA